MDKNKYSGVLILDCEAANPYYGCPTKEQQLRLVVCYSYDDKKSYCLYEKQEILDIINRHKYIVTFNGIGGILKGEKFDGYDAQLMYYNGYNNIIEKTNDDIYRFKYKINLDAMMIFRSRCASMKIKEGMLGDLLMSFSLDSISKTIGIVGKDDGKIQGFDYSLLLPEVKDWTVENKQIIETYALKDIEVTCKMYEWLEMYFDSFKDYLNQEDIEKKKYLTCSIASFVYKAVCNALGFKEEYNDNPSGSTYKGAVVFYPAGEEFHGTIWALDFKSLYPHMYIQANLFSPVKEGEGWHGNDMFKPIGTYNNKERGKIENFVLDVYNKRLKLKEEKSPKEYSAKILINSLYGCTGNPVFKNVYNQTAAADCTYLGRTCIKFARKTFMENGYKILAGDTDSNYILDPFNDEERLKKVRDFIVDTIKNNLPLPSDTFGMEIEAKITDMFFVKPNPKKAKKKGTEAIDEEDEKNKKLGYLKKNYIYVTSDGKVVYKGMGVKKKSSPEVCRYIFKNILLKKIAEDHKAKFSESYLQSLIYELLSKDLSMASIRFTAKPFNMYESEGDMHAQISKINGAGIHFMIPVKKDYYNKDGNILTSGKDQKYISLENFKNIGLKLQDIKLDIIYSGLEYFIKDSQLMLAAFT